MPAEGAKPRNLQDILNRVDASVVTVVSTSVTYTNDELAPGKGIFRYDESNGLLYFLFRDELGTIQERELVTQGGG